MAYSTQRAVSDGTMAYLDVSIQYMKRGDINVFYNDLRADPATWAWVGTTDKRIAFTPNVPNGVEVLLKRSTQINTIINVFSNGAKFNNATMDQDFTQLLYLNQEAVEGAALTDIFNDVDFHGYKIKNVGAAVDDTDVVSFGQLKTMSTGAYSAQLAAEAARDLAQKWASQLTTTVDGTSYSAKQYALNAATSATSATGSATAASSSASAAAGSASAATSAKVAAQSAQAAAESARNDAQAAAAPATELVEQVEEAVETANAAAALVATAAQKGANSDITSLSGLDPEPAGSFMASPVTSTGSPAFRPISAADLPARSALFTANGTMVVPDGITKMRRTGCAAGGAGGGSAGYVAAQCLNGGGGGAGQHEQYVEFTVVPGETLTIAVGAMATGANGGAVGAVGAAGAAGGNTSISGSVTGAIKTLVGGSGGKGGSSTAIIAAGGAGFPTGGVGCGATGIPAGLSIYLPSGAGADSPFGGGGSATSSAASSSAGTAATGYGAGGGGGGSPENIAVSGGPGGNSAPGFYLLEW